MSIKSFRFTEFKGEDRYWDLRECDFLDFNLIVGKNSTGKTRLINSVHALLRILAGSQKEAFESGTFDAKMDLHGAEYHFRIEFNASKVISENLTVNGEKMLSRTSDGTGKIFYAQKQEFISFQVDQAALAIQQRADTLQHPFVSDLATWARGARVFFFGTSFANNLLALSNSLTPNAARKINDSDNLIHTYISGFERFGDKFDEAIRKDMKKLGYNLTDVGAGDVAEMGLKHSSASTLIGIYAREQGIPVPLLSASMSQGMFRALGLVISMNIASFADDHTCVLVDDIGEGLDYDRSVALLDVVRQHSKKAKIQVIMTTNDRFIMNKVPLENWVVLRRKKSTVKAFTERNSPAEFNEFRYMGLSNFDFFTSNVFN